MLVAQLAPGKMEGERQKSDLGWSNVFLFMLWQSAVDHAFACQNGLACWLGHGQRRHWCGGTHQPTAPHRGLSHLHLLGAWLLPSCCSSVSTCTPWLGTYRHWLLLLYLILLLAPGAASYLSENESWTACLHAGHRVLRMRVATGEKRAGRLAWPDKSHKTSLLLCSPTLSIWLGHLFPTSSCHHSSSWLLHSCPKANASCSPPFLPLCAHSYVSCARFRRGYLIAATSSWEQSVL